MKYKAIVIGVSAGGMSVLTKLLSALNTDMKIIVVQHRARSEHFINHYKRICSLPVHEAGSLIRICKGNIYFAPAEYHLLIEQDETFSLSIDEKIKFCRPSIDILFETAADVYQEKLIGIILTGANDDGADGLKKINEKGGFTIVQDPKEAEYIAMPQAAIKSIKVDKILSVNKIITLLSKINKT